MKVIAVFLVVLATSLPGQIVAGGLGQNVVSLSFQTLYDQNPCGGTVIASTWVLTAAHCMDNSLWVKMYAESNSFLNGNVTRTVSAALFSKHSQYNSYTLANDLALIPVLDLSLELNLGDILLAFGDYTEVGQVGQLLGWEGGNAGQIMQIVNATIIKCESNITNTFCTTPMPNCFPPGSPFMVNGKLTGVLSLGAECKPSGPRNFDVYVKVINLREFIDQTIDP